MTLQIKVCPAKFYVKIVSNIFKDTISYYLTVCKPGMKIYKDSSTEYYAIPRELCSLLEMVNYKYNFLAPGT